MPILLFLLSAVMTFTVQSRTSVSMDGAPDGVKAGYMCTYQKGDVRAGDTATLSLTGLQSLQLEKVQVYLRSNKSAGAGVLTMTADGQLIYQKQGTYQEWFGAYDNTNYQPVGWNGKKVLTDGTLAVQLTGTTNSLHIEKYELTYTRSATQAYRVTLITDAEQEVLTETEPESGLILPHRADRGTWYFAGWAQTDISEATDEQPALLPAGERFYPKNDMSLWAVWTDVQQSTWERQTEPEDGYYVLELREYLLTGDVTDGQITLVRSDEVYTSDLYYLAFNTTDTTCTIRNYLSDAYVGYNAGASQLRQTASAWHYRVLTDSTWLFIAKEEGNTVWILFQKYQQEAAWLSDYYLNDNPNSAWSVYRVPDPDQTPRWWAHPATQAIPQVYDRTQDRILQFGIYEIHVKDGRKYMRLR